MNKLIKEMAKTLSDTQSDTYGELIAGIYDSNAAQLKAIIDGLTDGTEGLGLPAEAIELLAKLARITAADLRVTR